MKIMSHKDDIAKDKWACTFMYIFYILRNRRLTYLEKVKLDSQHIMTLSSFKFTHWVVVIPLFKYLRTKRVFIAVQRCACCASPHRGGPAPKGSLRYNQKNIIFSAHFIITVLIFTCVSLAATLGLKM